MDLIVMMDSATNEIVPGGGGRHRLHLPGEEVLGAHVPIVAMIIF